ncbi:hypothetical protein ABID21_004218 [Pseudorhizobium tarimense]|uniref:Amidohydrolase-related domain-containing protein n=1 Tax=Pseudorhizobium tarimense TaxID=1079109 RepID=A0ABV2HC08_9HYPH|nr:amidohydrolase family protein [Pseudorhizobium tarimense]MCJ8521142.1 amidohydrolase family protein [Pseudorhizobium tarimense]
MSMTLDFLIKGGSVITGDGKTHLEKAVIGLSRGELVVIAPGDPEPGLSAGHVIDATHCLVFPGIINAHAHNCVMGPSMPSGSAAPSQSEVNWQRNRHLLAGTTTLLNVCGLALPEELRIGDTHPLDIQVSTAHSPANIRSALSVDGKGLHQRHLQMTVETALLAGAKALGEVGGGQTLGGGAQEYKFIPQAVRRHTGRDIHPRIARRLRDAVVGRYLRPEDGANDEQLQDELVACGLADILDPAAARNLILASVMPSVELALAGFEEIARCAERTGYPAIFHNSTPSVKTLLGVAERYPKATLIAGHSNHPMFQPREAVDYAVALKRRNVIIDVSTLDCTTTRWRNDPANLDALVEAGCVNTISTDFAGGHWDTIPEALHRIIRKRQMDPAAAIALATGNVARTFPQLAGDRGFIENGKRADLVIADHANCARIRHVLIKGKLVVSDGVVLSDG